MGNQAPTSGNLPPACSLCPRLPTVTAEDHRAICESRVLQHQLAPEAADKITRHILGLVNAIGVSAQREKFFGEVVLAVRLKAGQVASVDYSLTASDRFEGEAKAIRRGRIGM
jgi:hypothetical protein